MSMGECTEDETTFEAEWSELLRSITISISRQHCPTGNLSLSRLLEGEQIGVKVNKGENLDAKTGSNSDHSKILH